MIDVLDDPFDGLDQFSKTIESYQGSVKRAVKDKNVRVTKKPTTFYVENYQLFNNSLQYYNDLLNNECPNDLDMQFSEKIRDKRSKYMLNLRKLISQAYQ